MRTSLGKYLMRLLVLTPILFVIGYWAHVQYIWHQVRAACDSVGVGDSREGLVARIQADGLLFTQIAVGSTDVVVVYKRTGPASPSCEIDIVDHRVVRSHFTGE